ncbi:MAG TPA: class I SAM-dependent methyltransferase [Armatimonadota bacterium]|jgi:SAM-dependent methyltransferase
MFTRKQRFDYYADGRQVSARRQDKAEILADALQRVFPARDDLELVDFGCADGAVPVLLLESAYGVAIRRITGITLLDYNDLPEKPAFAHPRFQRVIADLQGPLDGLSLPWGQCDAVTATALFHYFTAPDIPFAHAVRLLKPGGVLLAGMPARWVLRLRRHGLPGLLPRNTRIRQVVPLAAWARIAGACGLAEVSRQAVQWLGTAWSIPLERLLRRAHLPPWCASHTLVIYRKPE